jgi:hypothetical protein
MSPENYRPRDWMNGEIEAAKTLWNEHNTHVPGGTFNSKNPPGAGAWMIYLNDTRVCFNVFKSYD